MWLIRAPWVNHGNKDRRDKGLEVQIYAIDIHPDGTKVATAGEGDLGGRICIWNMKPILKKYAEKNDGIQKLLSKIDGHQQSVHTLRWSNSGECFASGGGDKLVMIWSSSGDNRYKSIATLRAHSLDVMDLAWSPSDEYLATASIDNLIVIWDAQRWPEALKIIRNHDNFVKGVSWDPIGKYLASQSDDKTLRVWRVCDWSEEVCIKEPFEDSNTSSTVTRIDWSPDGQYLVSAQAMNNDGFVSKIIERNNWTYEKDFVGHRKNITCVAFSPHIFKKNVQSKKKDCTESKIKPQCVLAIGSRDRSISVWETSRIRPVVVVNDVFENSVMDLSWSPCGYRLMACSLDGSVVLLEFTKNDLGDVYSADEKQQYLQQFYGKSFGTRKIRDTLIEDVSVILAQNDSNAKPKINGKLKLNDIENKKVDNNENNEQIEDLEEKDEIAKVSNDKKVSEIIKTDKNNEDKSNIEEAETDTVSRGGKQVEIRQADGKKRIMTLLKPKNQNIGIETSSTSSESKTKIIIETYDEKNLPKEVKEKFLNPVTNGNESPRDSESDSESEVGRKNCKKNKNTIEESSDEESIILRRKPKKRNELYEEDDEEVVIKKDKKKKLFTQSLEASKDEDSQQIILLNDESQQSVSLRRTHKKHKPRHVSITKTRQHVQVFSSERLTKQTHQNLKLFGDIDRFTYATIEYPSVSSSLVKLTVIEDEKTSWCTVLSSPIIFLSGNCEIIVVICDDMTLTTLNTKTGARINPSFVIGADIAKIMFGESKSHICVLTCEGKLWIWDLVIPRLVIKSISMIPILIDPKNNDKLTITKLNVQNNNVVISVSNGKTFQYDQNLKAWCLLKSANDPLAVTANYKGTRIDGFKKEILNTPSQKLMNLFSANTSFGQLCLISFIEQQIMRTKLINNHEEYLFWTKILVQNLVQMHSSGFNIENIEVRLRDLCSSLMGRRFPKEIFVEYETNNEQEKHFIKSEHSRKQLLNELLRIIASQTSLQRLYLEFKEQNDLFIGESMQI